MTQKPFYFFNASITSAATAVSVLSLFPSVPTGACVSLNVVADTNLYWGSAATVTNSDGALVLANTPISDAATGVGGSTIPLESMFAYSNAGGTTAVTIYARFIP